MYALGLEVLREAHRSILQRLEGCRKLTVTNAKDLSATSTLIRWGVLDAVETSAGRVVWKTAFDLKNQRQIRLIRRVYMHREVPLRDAPPKTTIELLELGLIAKEISSVDCKIRLKRPAPLVVILRNSVYSFGTDEG